MILPMRLRLEERPRRADLGRAVLYAPAVSRIDPIVLDEGEKPGKPPHDLHFAPMSIAKHDLRSEEAHEIAKLALLAELEDVAR